jgi:hypothetical protein
MPVGHIHVADVVRQGILRLQSAGISNKQFRAGQDPGPESCTWASRRRTIDGRVGSDRRHERRQDTGLRELRDPNHYTDRHNRRRTSWRAPKALPGFAPRRHKVCRVTRHACCLQSQADWVARGRKALPRHAVHVGIGAPALPPTLPPGLREGDPRVAHCTSMPA